MTKNIIHMIRYSCEEDFATICGINESCSERFYENLGQRLAYFGDDQKTTCKKCLTTFESMLKKEDSSIKDTVLLSSVDALTRYDIVPYYRHLIAFSLENKDEIKRVNNLILSRWKPSGLEFIKNKAWKGFDTQN